jgi:hypothetical protein
MTSRKPVPSRWWLDPYCYYCGRRVVKASNRPKPTYADVGTVEHIPPLWIARMMRVQARKVLACYSCNAHQNREVQKLFPPYFFHLWNGSDLPKQRRKMLMPGTGDDDP